MRGRVFTDIWDFFAVIFLNGKFAEDSEAVGADGGLEFFAGHFGVEYNRLPASHLFEI